MISCIQLGISSGICVASMGSETFFGYEAVKLVCDFVYEFWELLLKFVLHLRCMRNYLETETEWSPFFLLPMPRYGGVRWSF